MTTLNNTTLTRKIALGLGAIVVSTMTLSGAAEAKSKIHVDLHFGGGYSGVYFGPGYGYGYGPGYGWGGPNCYKYLKMYKKTGKWFWKKKFHKCKAIYW